MIESPLQVHFFQTNSGAAPVRDWLRGLPVNDRRSIGEDIKTVQFGWPLGMPLVRKIAKGLWEIRTHLIGRISRVLFTVIGNLIVLLHGFIKKSQRTPKEDLSLAQHRLQQVKDPA